MKNIFFFLLLFFIFTCNCCFCQGVRFQLYRTKACTVAEQLDTNYTMHKMPLSIDTDYFVKKGTVHLPGPGQYRIDFNDGFYLDTTIEIRDTGLFIFRVKEPDFGLYDGSMDSPMVYKGCGKLINGFFESYYPDGKIKMRGDFVRGYVKDSMLTYYNNGALKYKRLHFSKITAIEIFDSTAHRIKISTYQNGSILSYRWSRTKEYFPDGGLKLKKSDVKRIERIKEFYPDGHLKIKQTKLRRIEYYDNGIKKVAYKWRKKLELFEPHEKGIHDYMIHKTEYDEEREITKKTVYEDWNESGSPPRLDPEQSDWIISMVKYKNGKEIDRMKDVDMKNYQKK